MNAQPRITEFESTAIRRRDETALKRGMKKLCDRENYKLRGSAEQSSNFASYTNAQRNGGRGRDDKHLALLSLFGRAEEITLSDVCKKTDMNRNAAAYALSKLVVDDLAAVRMVRNVKGKGRTLNRVRFYSLTESGKAKRATL